MSRTSEPATSATDLRRDPNPETAPQFAQRVPDPGPFYRVERVAPYDVLNVRRGPSEYHPPVGALAANDRGVEITGLCQGEWCPIRQASLAGWVNRFYLSVDR
jgi:hypothetical protein